MMERMELHVSDYGSHLFRVMTGDNSHSEHWESIREEAEPLVRKLIELNYKMKGGGYRLHGYTEKKDGKAVKKKSDFERIQEAQKTWLVEAKTLTENDKVWTNNKKEDFEMYIGEHNPVPVNDITKNGVYIEHPFNHRGTHFLSPKDKVYKAPADWDEKEDEYRTDNYWLKIADELGI